MAVDIVKNKLSGSADGRGVLVAATATPGTLVHTARAITGAGQYDEVWLWCVNSSASAVKLTIEYGTVTAPGGNIEVTVAAEAGLLLILPGLVLRNGLLVRAFAATTNVLIVYGHVNEIG